MKIVLIFIGRHVPVTVAVRFLAVPALVAVFRSRTPSRRRQCLIRRRKLPLSTLVAIMLSVMRKSVHEGERQMLFQHLDRLFGSDLLLLDRGYPSRWLVAALNARGIGFCMRVEKGGNGGFACVRDFLRSGEDERIVTLAAPERQDALDYDGFLLKLGGWQSDRQRSSDELSTSLTGSLASNPCG